MHNQRLQSAQHVPLDERKSILAIADKKKELNASLERKFNDADIISLFTLYLRTINWETGPITLKNEMIDILKKYKDEFDKTRNFEFRQLYIHSHIFVGVWLFKLSHSGRADAKEADQYYDKAIEYSLKYLIQNPARHEKRENDYYLYFITNAYRNKFEALDFNKSSTLEQVKIGEDYLAKAPAPAVAPSAEAAAGPADQSRGSDSKSKPSISGAFGNASSAADGAALAPKPTNKQSGINPVTGKR